MALGLAEGVETQELYPPELRLWMQLWMKRIAHAILGYTVGSKPLFLPFCCSLADGSCLVEWLVGLLAFFFRQLVGLFVGSFVVWVFLDGWLVGWFAGWLFEQVVDLLGDFGDTASWSLAFGHTQDGSLMVQIAR